VEQLTVEAKTEAKVVESDLKRNDAWTPPRVSTAEWMAQSAEMADRWNRLFLRTLRALRDLRRYTPTLIVQNGVRSTSEAFKASNAYATTPT
jgi:hypothetical protein